MTREKIIIVGAAGRDFHNFNVHFRNREDVEVVAFTATQIPRISGRRYPPSLAGRHYPQGIPIYPQEDLTRLVREHHVSQVIFAYSDVSHEHVMHVACEVMAAGADFRLMGPESTMLQAQVPVISVCAVRTGAGKSQTTRRVCQILRQAGKRVAVIRHPMPYGDLERQRAQRFAQLEDLDTQHCTIEEREEYEPHIVRGNIVYAGVDYGDILALAEKEADVIVWDGGNNDFPFIRPDYEIVVTDPHRPGHEVSYYPGEVNLRRADLIVINKVTTAAFEGQEIIRNNVQRLNPRAIVVEGASPLFVEDWETIRGKRVLVVEDGPTLTHGEMAFGAGVIAAKIHHARELVDPRPHARGEIREVFEKYPKIGALLPAVGYSTQQIADLEATINEIDCELVLIGTPIDLRKVITINKPALRVTYELQEIGRPTLEDALRQQGLLAEAAVCLGD